MNLFDNFSLESLVVTGLVALVTIIVFTVMIRKIIKHKKPDKFRQQWRDLQKKLPDELSWPEAIIEADKLLVDALKKQKIKGKTTGEMLVKAEKLFTDKDEVWFGHKLSTKCSLSSKHKPNKKEVMRALVGLRQGINDLGAFDDKKNK